MKECPSCGEDVASAFTSSLPAKSAVTGPLDYNYVVRDIPVTPPVNGSDSKLNGNGKASVSPVLAAGSAMVEPFLPPPPPPIRSLLQANGPANGAGSGPTHLPPAVSSSKSASGAVAAPASGPVAANNAPANSVHTREAMLPTDLIRNLEICRRCQNELKTGAKFCSFCGASSEPSLFAKTTAAARAMLHQGLQSLNQGIQQAALPMPTIVLLALAGIFLLGSLIQYLIPVGVDAATSSTLIYHLRSIEFLLIALISVVASLVFIRR
jgi:hypothetical protein